MGDRDEVVEVATEKFRRVRSVSVLMFLKWDWLVLGGNDYVIQFNAKSFMYGGSLVH